MNSTTTTWTAKRPSGFALPACGHAVELRTRASVATTGVVAGAIAGTVRQRQESVSILGTTGAVRGGFTGDMDLATAYLPGTSAWRPPIC